MVHSVESPAVDFFSLPLLEEEFECSAFIAELQKPCFKWRVCLCRGERGSERGEKGETKMGHTHLSRKTTTKGFLVQIPELFQFQ
jgi:hypothetical protein